MTNPLRLPPDRRCEIRAEFSSRNEKARDAGFVTSKKYEAILLTKTAPLFISGSDLPQLWVQRSMDTVCEVCGLACGSLALTGSYDHHLQNDKNEPHSENDINDRHSQRLAANTFRNDNHIRHFEMM